MPLNLCLENLIKEVMKNIKIGRKEIGQGLPSYIIAEMSGNHCGNFELAVEIIKAAKKCGADAVKLQTYTPDTITLNSEKEDFKIPSSNPWSSFNTLYKVYEKGFTPWEWHADLFKIAKEVGIDIFSSPFDETAVDLLESLGAPAYKIASPEITHIPLLEKVAKTGKPVIVSTGVAQLVDIDLAVKTLKKHGCSDIILLKCTSSYPAPPESIHLKTIPNLSETFDCLAGLSDHTLGLGVPIGAVALGATVIEKHFILEKTPDSVDGFFSLDQQEFTSMVDEIRKLEKALGKVNYELDQEGMKNYWGRRSLYISASIKKGEVLTEKNMKCVRPSFGLHPKHYFEVLGKKVNRDLELGDRLSFDVIDDR
jgi:pseudaminic acid synthase